MEFIKQFDEITDLFFKEITKFKDNAYNLNQCEKVINEEKRKSKK